ncbi:DUF3108 domain-containing protein [Stenotrophobium rhamnosiphilum]|nr:DUF3108 domain-containing protein [Stenotrophobium rhamnosiphilum]
MRKLLWISLFVAGAASAADAVAPTPAPQSNDAVINMLKSANLSFDVDWNGIPLGDAIINLIPQGKGCYRYESQTRPVGAVRWLYGSPQEVSEFCVKDGVIRPSRYEYNIDKRPKDEFTLSFDWAAKKVTTVKGGKTTVRDLPDVAYDRFGMQQAIRLWVMSVPDTTKRTEAEFVSVDAKDINHYRFAILGHEKVETSVGTIDAIRIDRIDSKTRSTHSWVAPSRDFQVIKLESVNRGDVELKMLTNK